MAVRIRKIEIKETFCDSCGSIIEDVFNESLPPKCPDCGKTICSRCRGYYKTEVSKFRGHSGTTLPIQILSRTLCLECGVKFEAKLLELGLSLKPVLEKEID